MVISRVVTKNKTLLRDKFNDYLALIGRNDIQLNTITDIVDSDNKVIDTTTTNTIVTGDLQFVTYQDKQILEMGLATIGDGICYFIYDQTVHEFDTVTVDGVTWELNNMVEAETVQGGKVYQAWTCKRRM